MKSVVSALALSVLDLCCQFHSSVVCVFVVVGFSYQLSPLKIKGNVLKVFPENPVVLTTDLLLI